MARTYAVSGEGARSHSRDRRTHSRADSDDDLHRHQLALGSSAAARNRENALALGRGYESAAESGHEVRSFGELGPRRAVAHRTVVGLYREETATLRVLERDTDPIGTQARPAPAGRLS